MAYTGNPKTDRVLLVVINDGDGSQCGKSYKERVKMARKENPTHVYDGRGAWNALFRYAARRELRIDYPDLTDEDIRTGAIFLRQYYLDHIAEGA
jgi:hypothetical protein